MTAETTVIADNGVMQMFDMSGMPGNLDPGDLPVGKIVHRGQNAIALTGATDTMAVTITAALPQGYAFKVTKLLLAHQTVSGADGDEWERAAQFEYDQDGDDVFFYAAWKENDAISTRFEWLPSTTKKSMSTMTPRGGFSQIWGGGLNPGIVVRYNNTSSSATAASSLIHHIETHLYSIAQQRKPYIHRSQSTNLV